MHPRDSRSPEHGRWKKNISASMRRNRMRRRAVGLLTIDEAAAELALPAYTIQRMAECEQVRVIHAGSRRFISRKEIARLKAEFGENAA
jgi:hypothetical protein